MERTRRQILGLASAAVGAGAAGCLGPTGEELVSVDDGTVSGSVPDSDDGNPGSAEYQATYEAVAPSVVRVQTYVDGDDGGGGGAVGQGSGFRYDEDHVVTNDHVLGEPDAVRVQTAEGNWSEASVVGRDPYSDLAVIEASEPTPGDPLSTVSEVPPPGTEVLVVGSPLGLGGTVTQGIVSARNRTIPATATAFGRFSIADAVQVDAALNPGNSGGPIVDLDGRVIGVATATRGENVGFGVSSPLVEEVVPELIATGNYEHSYMGISVTDVDPLIAEGNGLAEAHGVYVVDVAPDGPSADALRGADGETTVDGATVSTGGDAIVGLDDAEVRSRSDLSQYLALSTRPGDEIDVTVLRDGGRETVAVELDARPDPR